MMESFRCFCWRLKFKKWSVIQIVSQVITSVVSSAMWTPLLNFIRSQYMTEQIRRIYIVGPTYLRRKNRRKFSHVDPAAQFINYNI